LDSIGGIEWSLRAPEAVRAELVRRYPYKLPESIDVTVPHVVREIERAWRCYLPRHPPWDYRGSPPALLPGAAAALFDVVRALGKIRLPLPDGVRWELETLARAALSGEGVQRGQGASSPIEAHRKALRKRWRHAWVVWVVQNGHLNALEVETFARCGFPPGFDRVAWEADRASWPEVTEMVTRACALARDYSGDKSPQWRAFYDDYREVNDYYKNNEECPGIFYIPTEETCDDLGWDFVNQMARDFTGRDAPLFIVS
jgi:hypothetical protein